MQITSRDIEQGLAYARNLQRNVGSHREKVEYATDAIATQAESGLAAFGYGFVEGRWGPVKVGPLSADLLGGLLLHGIGLFGVAGKASKHANNFATGLIDGYVHRLGMGLGAAMGAAATPAHAIPSVADPRGAFHVGAMSARRGDYAHRVGIGAVATPAEIAAMTASMR